VTLVARGRALFAALTRTRAYRAWTRFGDAKGNLLAAGVAYFGFFSLFPAVALAAVVFGFLLAGSPELLDDVGRSLDEALPGLVQTADNPDGLMPLAAPETATLSWAGAVAFVSLVLGGLGWIGSLRDGIRSVFGVRGSDGNPVLAKLRDLLVMGLLGASLLVSAVSSSVVAAASTWVSDLLGLGQGVVTVAGVAVSFILDTAVMVVLLRVLSGVPLPWKDIRSGALLGGLGMTVLKMLAATLIAMATRNPLFGSFVVVVGLLFWLNLVSRLVLLSAAWAANDIDTALADLQGAVAPREAGTAAAADPDAAQAELDTPQQRLRDGLPYLGRRDTDRVNLAAGALVGAAAAMGVTAIGRTLRLLLPGGRRTR
jgi:membrane protein